MNVTSKMKMDLTKPELKLSANAVQGDAYSRALSISLYTGPQPWTIPGDALVAVRYAKPDRTRGYYDTLPDGTRAWSIQDNTLTVLLAPQMLTVAGTVTAQIELIQGSHILSTFGLAIYVEPNPAADLLQSENYFNWIQWIQDQSAEQVLKILQSVQTAVQAADDSAAYAKQAAESAAIAEGIKSYTKQESDLKYSPVIQAAASGSSVTLTDSLHHPLHGLTVYGKTIQNATPTPENPVALDSAGQNGTLSITVGNSDADPAVQRLVLSTPGGLSGIAVNSGGNYTDEHGQQWICDEVDFARGVYVQRIGRANNITFQELTDSNGYPAGDSLFFLGWLQAPMSSYTTAYRLGLCNKLPYKRNALNNDINGFYFLNARIYCRIKGVSDLNTFRTMMEGAEFLVPLEPPIEKPLSDAERAAYAALYTQDPVTVLSNDGGARMNVLYAADTKRYIDSRISALTAQCS